MNKGRANLIPANAQSKEERRANGRKGGRASGEARRRKKALRAILKGAVSIRLDELPDDMRAAIMAAARIADSSMTVADALVGALILSACAGNARMMKLLLDTLGETSDIRLRGREVRLKERDAAGEHSGNSAPITFVFEREGAE